MAYLYLRRNTDGDDDPKRTYNDNGNGEIIKDGNEWYVGRTGKKDLHARKDSRNAGAFATDMQGNILAKEVPNGEAEYQESEAIQFSVGFFGRRHVRNVSQVNYPVTGIEIDEG